MSFAHEFLTLAVISFLGALSPGPDFIVVAHNSLKYGRRGGLWTTLGVGLGCLIHITYCIVGIGVIVSQSILLFNIIKYCGAAYLIYIGIKALLAKSTLPVQKITGLKSQALEPGIPAHSLIKRGFIVNALNPKATLFFLSIFTQVIDPATPHFIQFCYGMEMVFIGLLWFTVLSLLLTHGTLKEKINKIHKYIDKLLGGVLVILGIKVASMS